MTQRLTQLCWDAAELELAVGSRLAAADCDAVVLFVLGLEPADFIPFAQTVASNTPVFLADCYDDHDCSRPCGQECLIRLECRPAFG